LRSADGPRRGMPGAGRRPGGPRGPCHEVGDTRTTRRSTPLARGSPADLVADSARRPVRRWPAASASAPRRQQREPATSGEIRRRARDARGPPDGSRAALPGPDGGSAHGDADVDGLEELLDPLDAALATEARVLDPAERRRGVGDEAGVDAD